MWIVRNVVGYIMYAGDLPGFFRASASYGLLIILCIFPGLVFAVLHGL